MEALIETQITFLCVVVVVTTILATQTLTNPFITARDDHLEMNEPDKWKCAKTKAAVEPICKVSSLRFRV